MSPVTSDFPMNQESAATSREHIFWDTLISGTQAYISSDLWWKMLSFDGFVVYKGKLHYYYDPNPRSVQKQIKTERVIKMPKRFLKGAIQYKMW